MSASIMTRDGMPSIAGLELARLDAAYGTFQVDQDEALQWARANGVVLVPGESSGPQMARINVKRREFELPIMVLRPAPARTLRPAAVASPKVRQVAAPPAPKANASRTSAVSKDVAEMPPPIAANEDEILDLVTGFSGTRTGLVTPQIAAWLLAMNTGNRPLQRGQVARFRDILARGGWENTGEPVIVSREGVLNEGQHRLQAIAESGIAAPLDVRFGIARAAFASTGTGLRRTAGHVVAIAGGKHASAQAAIARMLRYYDAGEMARTSQQVEPSDILAIIGATPNIAEIAAAQKSCRFAPARTAPVGMVLTVAARTVPMEKIAGFLAVLDSGIAAETDAARLLHVRLRDAAMKKERLSQIDTAAMAVRAWNSWLAGKTQQFLRMPESDRTSTGFPRIQG